MVDRIVYDLTEVLSRNKNRSYRDSVIQKISTLMGFMQAHELLRIDPFDANKQIKMNLVIKLSDLTEEGIKLFDEPVKKWWQYIDRGGKPDNISHLEKGLISIRESGNP